MSTLNQIYAKGIADEHRVILFLSKHYAQHCVLPSTTNDNIHHDIDCHVGCKKVSIKAQHAGAKYGNIYFELLQRPRNATKSNVDNIRITDIPKLENKGWVKSWYYKSQADIYAILQGDTLRLYAKKDIERYVQTTGFIRLRPLTKNRQDYLIEADYAYNNAICGYIDTESVQHLKLTLDPVAAPVPVAKPIKRDLTHNPRNRQLQLL